MARMRKPFQGVINIIKFNWQFYMIATGLIAGLLIVNLMAGPSSRGFTLMIVIIVLLPILISLSVSYYIYDVSNLYSLDWLDVAVLNPGGKILNVNAGFDETSILLHDKYPGAELIVFDFYDPVKHTAVSIRRARKSYPPFPGTVAITTSQIPLEDKSIENIFVILAAHEIRGTFERINFFKELNRVIGSGGKIIVTEHLRDLPNFLAYNIGFFHFLSASMWNNTFNGAGLTIAGKIKITPFITTYILHKNGIAS